MHLNMCVSMNIEQNFFCNVNHIIILAATPKPSILQKKYFSQYVELFAAKLLFKIIFSVGLTA